MRRRPEADLHSRTDAGVRLVRIANVHDLVCMGDVHGNRQLHAGSDAGVWSMRNAIVHDRMRLEHVRRRGRVHAGSDATLRSLRHADMHGGLCVGNMHRGGPVRGRCDSRGDVRQLRSRSLQRELHLGRVHAAPRQRVRVPCGCECSRVLGVYVRATVVPVVVSVEHRVHVVLLLVWWVPVSAASRGADA